MDPVSKSTVKLPNGSIISEQQYGYNGNLPGIGSPTTPKPTLSRVVDGSQTIDTQYLYDSYGNVYETDQYKAYGTTSNPPSSTLINYLTSYDTDLKTYVISSDPPLLPATTTTYDYGLGLPITVTDPNNNTTTTTYDGLGRTTSIKYQDYDQANVRYTYPDPSGSPLAVVAPFALKMEMWDETVDQYRASWQIMDGLGRVIQTQGPYETAGMLVLTDTSYNAQGLALYQGLPRTITGTGGGYSAPSWGSVLHTTTGYDALGRAVSVAYPDGTAESTSYSGLRTTFTDRNNHQKVQENDALGRLVKVEEYTGSNPYTLYATTQYMYDERDLLKQVTDAAGNLTVLNYDGFGRKTDMTDPDLGNWRYRYDPFGHLTAQIDAKRQAVNLYYDDLNRLVGKTHTAGPVNADTYQPPADPGYSGYTIKYYYDQGTNGYGRRTRMEDPSGYTTWSYDALGQVTSGAQNIDNTTYNSNGTYDAFGRPLTQVLPSTETLNYTYNAMGALSGLGGTLNGTSPYVSQIHYNASGQMTDQLLGNGLRQQSCYNASNLRLAGLRVYPGSLQTCIASPSSPKLDLAYSYEANGNISQIFDSTRSETWNYTYDALDRLLSASGTDNRNYAYTSIGNISSRNVSQPNPGTNGLVSWWKLDETSATRTDSNGTNHLTDNNTVGFTSGKQGNAAQFVMNNNEYLSIADNPSVSMGNGARMTICTWVKLNSKSGVQNFVSKRGAANGTWEYFLRYDGRQDVDRFVFLASSDGYAATTAEVKADAFGSPSTGTWYFVCGGYDGANAWISVNSGTRNTIPFTTGIYDGSNMLRIGSGYNAEYVDGTLDEMALYRRSLTPAEVEWLYNNGNGRTYADLSLPTPGSTTFSYGDTTHKHAVTSLSTGESYTYDANGNMTCRVEGVNTYKQEYDVENKLIYVRKMSGNCSGTVLETTKFDYDGDGNLVMKTNPNSSRTIYIGGVYEVDKNSGGTVTGTKTYYPAGGAMRVNGTLYYILKDHLGSASVVTDDSGNPVGEQRFYPFGETRTTSGTMNTDRLYTGQRDTGLGIYYYNARFYSPYINHFISADTVIPSYVNPQDLNRYSYVNNNPLRYTDPTGHMMDQGDMGGGSGCSNPIYCRGGKPKPQEELKRIREQNLGKPPFVKAPPKSVTTLAPIYSTFPSQQCTNGNPCLNNLVPLITPTPQPTVMPLPQAVNTVVAGASDAFNNVCMPSLSGTQGCGAVIDQAAQGLGAFNPLPPGTGQTIDTMLAGASGANEIANNVHISEPTGQGYINGGIYLGVAEVTSLFPLLIFFVLP